MVGRDLERSSTIRVARASASARAHAPARASAHARASTAARIAFAMSLAAGCAFDEDAGSAAQTIIGGEASDRGEYPATGALVRGRSYRCTATLIAPDVALTAAHCLSDDGFGELGFTLDPDLTDGIDGLVPLLVDHRHPGFRADGEELARMARRNDIGVLVLAHPIEGVPFEELDVEGEAAALEEAELTLCAYGRDWWSTPGSAGRKRDAVVHLDRATSWELQTIGEDPQPCKGDSGGPLFASTGGRRRLVGLVSRAAGGSRMCDTGAIYTRVAPYADWIAEASLDRDPGCSASGGAHTLWPALLGWLILVLWPASTGRAGRPRRSRPFFGAADGRTGHAVLRSRSAERPASQELAAGPD
jgi:hypothetical protein